MRKDPAKYTRYVKGVMKKNMEATALLRRHRGYTGIMEKKAATAIAQFCC